LLEYSQRGKSAVGGEPEKKTAERLKGLVRFRTHWRGYYIIELDFSPGRGLKTKSNFSRKEPRETPDRKRGENTKEKKTGKKNTCDSCSSA